MEFIEIDLSEYEIPECKCEDGIGHICYIRPKPTIVENPGLQT